PGIGVAQPVAKPGAVLPAHRAKARNIGELAWNPVRPEEIEAKRTAEADHLSDRLRKLADRDLFARSDVHGLLAAIVPHEEHERLGQIVDVQELAQRPARSPDRHGRRATHLRLMRL